MVRGTAAGLVVALRWKIGTHRREHKGAAAVAQEELVPMALRRERVSVALALQPFLFGAWRPARDNFLEASATTQVAAVAAT